MTTQYTNFSIFMKNGKNFVNVPREVKEIMLWGPYQRLKAGKYEVEYNLYPTNYNSLDDLCCEIDVVSDLGSVTILRRSLTVRDLIENNNKIALSFDLSKVSECEYRVFALGGSGVEAAYLRRAVPVGEAGAPEDAIDNLIYEENFSVIDYARKCGVRIDGDGDGLIAKADGIEFSIQSPEDMQVMDEVFLAKDYNIVPSFPCVVIDIGMNVGLASLAFAAAPHVEAVFAYEPFQIPFQRAIENFARNPALQAKIRPHNYGLADRDETLEVKIDPQATIGTSIRGLGDGDPERIEIRDAAAELGPKIVAAAERGLGVVMKVDCEGSEFAIFDSLRRAALFPKIDAFMIEWHKWWSADKTQADLIAPLTEAGYMVFDRTSPGDLYAGFLYAVRSARGVEPSGR